MIEDIIREAMERGDFDDLPGKGKPLDLTQDPLLDPITSIVHRMLREEGLSHPLLEARKGISAETQQCREELERAWKVSQGAGSAWDLAVQRFRDRITEINRQVRLFNLKSPSPALHGLVLDADAEIAKLFSRPTQPNKTSRV